MFFGVRRVSCVLCCLSFVVSCFSCVVWRAGRNVCFSLLCVLLCNDCCLMFVVSCCVSFIVRCLVCVACLLLFVVCCMSLVVCCVLFVACSLLCVVR